MQRKEYSKYYFIGVGGIGMSALARYVVMQGKQAFGYDATRTDLTINLEDEGVSIVYKDVAEGLPEGLNAVDTLVIYTPAIGVQNSLLKHFEEKGFTCIKRAKFLGYITEPTVCLAVAGTHGKTTTASILAHLLIDSGKSVSAFLGGIPENYKSNFIYRGSVLTVVEADEYDRSFLNLSPSIACITNIDADHLDIYESEDAFKEAFKEFGDLLQNRSDLVHPVGLDFGGTQVGINKPADYYAKNIRIFEGSYRFDLFTPGGEIKNFVFSMPGEHNLMNALMALTMALKAGVPGPMLVNALPRFEGIDRRFSFRFRSEEKVIIEDYAHHPTELTALYKAVVNMYPNEKVALVFQPHLYSRTRDFGEAFAESLSLFDELLLMDIYPARELPIDGIDSQWVLDQVTSANNQLVSKENLFEAVKNTSAKVVVMAGAGDISQEVKRIVKELEYEK